MTMTDDQLPDGWEITQKPKPPAYDRFMAVKGKTQIEAFTWPRLVEFARTQDAIEQVAHDGVKHGPDRRENPVRRGEPRFGETVVPGNVGRGC